MIIVVILLLSLLIFAHEAGHFFVAKRMGMKVDEFGFGFPPRLYAWKKGETEYSINLLPFGGFVKIAGEQDSPVAGEEIKDGRLFFAQAAWKRALVIAAGVLVNFILGWILISLVFAIGTSPVLLVSNIEKDSPAAAAGIIAGDILKDFSKAEEFIHFVNDNRGKEITLHILRAGEEKAIVVTPRKATEEGKGALGVYLSEGGIPRESIPRALLDGLRAGGEIILLTAKTLGTLITTLFSQGKLLEGIVGPVGIVSVAAETGKIGFLYLLQLIAIISLNLTAMNLIPFPALDGGRLLMIAIEKIKGSPVSKKVEAYVNAVGFLLLLALMVVLTVRDVGRL